MISILTVIFVRAGVVLSGDGTLAVALGRRGSLARDDPLMLTIWSYEVK